MAGPGYSIKDSSAGKKFSTSAFGAHRCSLGLKEAVCLPPKPASHAAWTKADQLPRDYGGTVDFDILGTAWSEEAASKQAAP